MQCSSFFCAKYQRRGLWLLLFSQVFIFEKGRKEYINCNDNIFTAPAPNPGDFWCTPPYEVPTNYTDQWIAQAHPKQISSYNNRTTVNYCEVYAEVWKNPLDFIGPNKSDVVPKNLTTIECERFSFNPDYYSLIADYSLVCDRHFWVSLSQCFHIFGLLIGGIIAYYMLK